MCCLNINCINFLRSSWQFFVISGRCTSPSFFGQIILFRRDYPDNFRFSIIPGFLLFLFAPISILYSMSSLTICHIFSYSITSPPSSLLSSFVFSLFTLCGLKDFPNRCTPASSMHKQLNIFCHKTCKGDRGSVSSKHWVTICWYPRYLCFFAINARITRCAG